MRKRFKYGLARLITLLVALHTLDVSIDTDHLTAHVSWYDSEDYDDMDSISEFFLEKIFDDNNLVAERDNEDRYPGQRQISKFSIPLFYVVDRESLDIDPGFSSVASVKPAPRNTRFLFEDHSFLDDNPPNSSGYFKG